jgi:16S rRNA (adenine1518-N6/adenine1519-N6)-dimethyltransferase
MHQPKKRFGQNFIKDKNLLKKMVDSAEIKGLNVLEIGPGLGALTQFLTVDAKKYLAYEIDYSLKPTLKSFESSNASFKFMDFLEDEHLSVTLQSYFGDEEVHLVGNLPYYITTPIIFKFLETKKLKSATIMIQKEVGERMVSNTNTKAYNAFSAILQYYCKVVRIMNVDKKMFYPVPKVDSMVIKLTKKELPLSEELSRRYEMIVKMAFAQKRKTLVNNIADKIHESKEKIQAFLKELGYQEQIRAENLLVEDFIRLTTNWPF